MPKLQGGWFIFSVLNNAKLIYAFVWITITCNSFLKQSTSWSQLKAWHIYEGVSVFVEPAALPHSNVWGDPGSKVEISHQKQSIKYAQFFCCVEQCWWCMDMWQKLHFWINFLYDREHYILLSSRILILIPKGLSEIQNMEHIIQHHLSYLCVSCKKHIAVDSAWLSVLKLSGVGGCVLFNEYTQAFGWTKHTFFKRIGLFK